MLCARLAQRLYKKVQGLLNLCGNADCNELRHAVQDWHRVLFIKYSRI